ncbi:hypothetical protein PTKIN_Ptkin04bG0116200 [Pterospermum kingtungense]
MPLSTLISLFQNMETAKVPVCLSMTRYMRRKKYQRLKRMVSTKLQEDNENENETEEYDGKGMMMMMMMMKSNVMVPKASPQIANNLPVEPLRRWRDAYVEMMLCFAEHVMQLNSGRINLGQVENWINLDSDNFGFRFGLSSNYDISGSIGFRINSDSGQFGFELIRIQINSVRINSG